MQPKRPECNKECHLNPIVIFGAGNIAQLADFYFREDASRQVAAFTVDEAHLADTKSLGRPLVGWETVVDAFPPAQFDVFVAVSYRGLNQLRRAKVEEARAKGYRLASYVSSRATRFSTFEPGENQFILEDNTVQPFAAIGNNVTLWSGNHIGHHSTVADDVFIASHVVVSGGASIGARSFLGVNVTVRDHVRVGEDCIIGAGALILKDVPDGSVVSPGPTEPSRVPSHRLKSF